MYMYNYLYTVLGTPFYEPLRTDSPFTSTLTLLFAQQFFLQTVLPFAFAARSLACAVHGMCGTQGIRKGVLKG